MAQDRNTSLGIAASVTARRYVFERVFFRTSFKSATVNLPTNCMFVVIPIEELRSVSYAKGAYTQPEQKFQRRMLASDKHLPNRLELGVAPTRLYSSGNFEIDGVP
jgi:hypothetical protein